MTPYVRPDVAQFLAYLNAQPGPKTHELPAPAARQLFKALPQLADLPPEPLATVTDLAIPGPAGPIPARLFDAADRREPGPAVVFFHGGGFVIGDLDTHAGPCATIATLLGLPVIAVDYRLAPEAPWPAAPDDCEAAARWVADSPAALGRSVTGLVLCGDRAGGTLTIVTAAALRDRPAAVPVLVQAPLYPAADLSHVEGSMQDFAEGYMLTHDTLRWFADAYAADISHARGNPILGDMAGMPPAVVVTAGLDPLRDQGRRYAAALIAAGVPVTYREAAGTIHGFINLRRAIPSAQGDLLGFLSALKPMIAEAEGARVMAQAAGGPAGGAA
jgi:acetyl esterase